MKLIILLVLIISVCHALVSEPLQRYQCDRDSGCPYGNICDHEGFCQEFTYDLLREFITEEIKTHNELLATLEQSAVNHHDMEKFPFKVLSDHIREHTINTIKRILDRKYKSIGQFY